MTRKACRRKKRASSDLPTSDAYWDPAAGSDSTAAAPGANRSLGITLRNRPPSACFYFLIEEMNTTDERKLVKNRWLETLKNTVDRKTQNTELYIRPGWSASNRRSSRLASVIDGFGLFDCVVLYTWTSLHWAFFCFKQNHGTQNDKTHDQICRQHVEQVGPRACWFSLHGGSDS